MQKGGPEEGVRSVMAQAKVVVKRTAASTSRRQDFRASKSLVRKYVVKGKNRMRLDSEGELSSSVTAASHECCFDLLGHPSLSCLMRHLSFCSPFHPCND